jgi:hypothetical protein
MPSGIANSIIGGGEYSYIRVHRFKKQMISKEINDAEHEYMNIAPPPPIIEFARLIDIKNVHTFCLFEHLLTIVKL